METNEHIIKIIGMANLPEELILDKNYKIICETDIVSRTEEKNDNGTVNIIYKAKLITVEIEKDNGYILKSKDVRKMSQKLRSALWYQWKSEGDGDFEDYYNHEMQKIIDRILV